MGDHLHEQPVGDTKKPPLSRRQISANPLATKQRRPNSSHRPYVGASDLIVFIGMRRRVPTGSAPEICDPPQPVLMRSILVELREKPALALWARVVDLELADILF